MAILHFFFLPFSSNRLIVCWIPLVCWSNTETTIITWLVPFLLLSYLISLYLFFITLLTRLVCKNGQCQQQDIKKKKKKNNNTVWPATDAVLGSRTCFSPSPPFREDKNTMGLNQHTRTNEENERSACAVWAGQDGQHDVGCAEGRGKQKRIKTLAHFITSPAINRWPSRFPALHTHAHTDRYLHLWVEIVVGGRIDSSVQRKHAAQSSILPSVIIKVSPCVPNVWMWRPLLGDALLSRLSLHLLFIYIYFSIYSAESIYRNVYVFGAPSGPMTARLIHQRKTIRWPVHI